VPELAEIMIQACLFDIGNVLVSFDYSRTFGKFVSRTPRTFDEIRLHLSEMTEELETGRLSTEDFISRATAFIGGDVSRAEFTEAFTRIFEPIQPVWDLVETVRAAVPVHLFSNTSELHELYLFQEYPGFSRFHGGFYSWRLGTMKPDAAIYEHALATLGLPAEAVAYIDDLPPNVETGRRLGFRTHQYDHTRHGELVEFLTGCGLMAG
jgi:putative hydrolase of the HAD superfamily